MEPSQLFYFSPPPQPNTALEDNAVFFFASFQLLVPFFNEVLVSPTLTLVSYAYQLVQ